MDKRRMYIAGAIAVFLLVGAFLFTRRDGPSVADDVRQAGEPTSATAATAATSATSTATEPTRPYTAATGYYVSESDAMGKTTRETWFEDYGRRQASYVTSTVEMMGQKFVTRSVEIVDGEWRTEYDVDEKTGRRFRLPSGAAAAGDTPAIPDISALTGEQKLEMQIEELQPRTIAGREATGMSIVVSGLRMRAWTWEGIQMRSEVFLGEKPMVTEVTKLEFGVTVPEEKFEIPADVKLVTP